MEKLCVFFILALAVNQAVGMSLRQKRQSTDDDGNLEDRYGWDTRPNWNQFPGQDQFPGQGRPVRPGQGRPVRPGQGQQTSSTTTPASAGTTTQSSAYQECIRTCPVTPEFNPVCGTNNITYSNPGRLICAQNCGTDVTQLRTSPCPAAPASG